MAERKIEKKIREKERKKQKKNINYGEFQIINWQKWQRDDKYDKGFVKETS